MSERDGKGDDDRGAVDSSAPKIPKKAATFPPDRWTEGVVSKTRPPATVPPSADIPLPGPAGERADDDGPPGEIAARNFIATRFAAAGYRLALDHRFVAPGVAVRLDAYDPAQRTGFAYISHADADVVSDIGAGEELAFKALWDTGEAFVLIVHDHQIDTLATLERAVDDFLGALHRRR